MNKKLLQILLVIFVVGIWGKVGYDFFKFKKEKDPQVQSEYIPTLPVNISKPFNYDLNLDYRDPFLGKYAETKPPKKNRKPRPTIGSKNTKKAEEPKKPKLNVKWPRVEYVGNINNEKAKKESVTLKVNGEESFMLPGHEIQGVTLKALYLDSLVVVYQEEEKTILR